MKRFLIFITLLFFLAGAFFRLYHIEFGLPHSFYADEPEIAELAIKYTFEFRNIIRNNDYHEFIPISFVYGAFPSYLNTAAVMAFSKSMNIAGIEMDKTGIYIFMRTLNALLSMIIIPAVGILSYKLFKNKYAAVAAVFLIALNWKLIVHAHYINADITQTILICLSFLSLFLYYKKDKDTKYTVATGVLFGLAAATKITTLMTIPFYWYIFAVKKDVRGLVAFSFITFGAYILGNPFSMILANNFAFRVLLMLTKEGGLVFDSANLDPLKYVKGLFYISTIPAALFSLYGKYKVKVNVKILGNSHFHIFLLLNVLTYVAFFSLQSRNIERWLLPVLPIVIIYASYGTVKIAEAIRNNFLRAIFLIILLLLYLEYPVHLLSQFSRYTPKAEAYLWLRDNTKQSDKILIYTEEGLDPTNKLPSSKVHKVEVYASEAAQFFMPEDPFYYDYVVLSSRPMSNYKNPAVKNEYPFYYEKWSQFENTVLNPDYFILVKSFVLPKPNLIPLSDVFVYKNLSPALVLENDYR